jgi:predicted nucleic acid-binding protein
MMITIGASLDKVRETQDAVLAGKIADFLRFKRGLNYNQIAALAAEHGIDAETWEALQYEADVNE